MATVRAGCLVTAAACLAKEKGAAAGDVVAAVVAADAAIGESAELDPQGAAASRQRVLAPVAAKVLRRLDKEGYGGDDRSDVERIAAGERPRAVAAPVTGATTIDGALSARAGELMTRLVSSDEPLEPAVEGGSPSVRALRQVVACFWGILRGTVPGASTIAEAAAAVSRICDEGELAAVCGAVVTFARLCARDGQWEKLNANAAAGGAAAFVLTELGGAVRRVMGSQAELRLLLVAVALSASAQDAAALVKEGRSEDAGGSDKRHAWAMVQLFKAAASMLQRGDAAAARPYTAALVSACDDVVTLVKCVRLDVGVLTALEAYDEAAESIDRVVCGDGDVPEDVLRSMMDLRVRVLVHSGGACGFLRETAPVVARRLELDALKAYSSRPALLLLLAAAERLTMDDDDATIMLLAGSVALKLSLRNGSAEHREKALSYLERCCASTESSASELNAVALLWRAMASVGDEDCSASLRQALAMLEKLDPAAVTDSPAAVKALLDVSYFAALRGVDETLQLRSLQFAVLIADGSDTAALAWASLGGAFVRLGHVGQAQRCFAKCDALPASEGKRDVAVLEAALALEMDRLSEADLNTICAMLGDAPTGVPRLAMHARYLSLRALQIERQGARPEAVIALMHEGLLAWARVLGGPVAQGAVREDLWGAMLEYLDFLREVGAAHEARGLVKEAAYYYQFGAETSESLGFAAPAAGFRRRSAELALARHDWRGAAADAILDERASTLDKIAHMRLQLDVRTSADVKGELLAVLGETRGSVPETDALFDEARELLEGALEGGEIELDGMELAPRAANDEDVLPLARINVELDGRQAVAMLGRVAASQRRGRRSRQKPKERKMLEAALERSVSHTRPATEAWLRFVIATRFEQSEEDRVEQLLAAASLLSATFTPVPLVLKVFRTLGGAYAGMGAGPDAAMWEGRAQSVALRHRLVGSLTGERDAEAEARIAEASSFSVSRDAAGFQREFVDTLPEGWATLSLSLSPEGSSVMAVRSASGAEPVVVRFGIPSAGGEWSAEAVASSHADFVQANIKSLSAGGKAPALKNAAPAAPLDAIFDENAGAAAIEPTRAAKKAFWTERFDVEERLAGLLRGLEKEWFSWRKALLLGMPADEGEGTSAEAAAVQFTDRRAGGEGEAPAGSLALLLSAGDRLSDVEVVQAVEEADASLFRELQLENGTACRRREVILILDQALQRLPLESMPSVRGQVFTRMPSLLMVRAACLAQGTEPVDARRGRHFINPGRDLVNTQKRFTKFLPTVPATSEWAGTMGAAPTLDEFMGSLEASEVVLYCGHGAGQQYVSLRRLEKQRRCAIALLMGCSSGKLRDEGDHEPTGLVLRMLIAGSRAVVANLWDVTDGDIDTLTQRLIEGWLSDRLSLAAALAASRDSCKLTLLVGAAPVCYGLPNIVTEEE